MCINIPAAQGYGVYIPQLYRIFVLYLLAYCLYTLSFVTQIFRNGYPSHGGERKTFEVMTST
jgi:hypothetical protein